MSEKTVVQRSNDAVKKQVSTYNALFDESTSIDQRKENYKTLVSNYYSVSTDFYEYGWGTSFHFANRFHGETLAESIQRHESYLALKMNIKSGEKVLDIGCGVGGPLRRIAHLTGAHITGVTISQYQIQRAKAIGKMQSIMSTYSLEFLSNGVSHAYLILGVPTGCQFIYGDFMKLPFDSNTFDHVFVIEAACHAPDKASDYPICRRPNEIAVIHLVNMFCRSHACTQARRIICWL
jgi:sterol 24-C-methyltransferase